MDGGREGEMNGLIFGCMKGGLNGHTEIRHVCFSLCRFDFFLNA